MILIGFLLAFYIVALFHNYNHLTTKYAPFFYAYLSYVGHTGLLFSGKFDDPNDPFNVHLSKDMLFRRLI